MFDFSWYQILNQPPLAPPAWVFSPTWVVLYMSMAVSLFIFIKKQVSISKVLGYVLFFLQLFVNLSWTPAFFGMRNIFLALVILILLDILVLFNIIEFYKVSKISAKILIPYFLWILFATYLNLGVLILN